MPTYAILGATGNCGTALLNLLISRKDTVKVRAFCRNRDKLLRAAPDLVENKRVEILTGSIYDVDLLVQCIKDTRTVFHVVSTNTNVPNCNVGLEAANSIVRALERIRAASQGEAKLPKIVLLSSATIDSHLSSKMPWFFQAVLLRSGSNVYRDLRRTEAFLRAHQDTVTTIFIKPGGLSVDTQRGHKLDFDHEDSFVSYLDLAAAMIEAADNEDGRYDMKNVGVVNTNGSARFPPGTLWCILTGLVRHYLPFMHPYLPTPGPT